MPKAFATLVHSKLLQDVSPRNQRSSALLIFYLERESRGLGHTEFRDYILFFVSDKPHRCCARSGICSGKLVVTLIFSNKIRQFLATQLTTNFCVSNSRIRLVKLTM